jgi:LPS-assembly protein
MTARALGPACVRGLFVAGAVVAATLAGSAMAQPIAGGVVSPPKTAPKAPPADDGLRGGGYYLEANSVVQDDANHRVTAEGAVEVRYMGRVLRADEVDYQTQTSVVTARGHVVIIEADGTTQFSSAVTLDKDFSQGIALGYSTRMSQNVKIAAASAHRQGADITVMNKVIFTPCPICAEKGGKGTGQPTWSIRARKVVDDHKRQTIYFQDAVIQVLGVGVFYFPALKIAEPVVEKKSGFLLPYPTISSKRGFSYEQPYYQVISPSIDLTVTPQINTKVNPFLNVEYRERFYSGSLDIRAGYTYSQDFNSQGQQFGDATSRSYILGSGVFNLSPTWLWGFTAEQVSDTLLFDKYSIGDVYKESGLYAADDRRLISQLYVVQQNQNSYLSVAAMEVQGLRSTDQQSTFPIMAPVIEGHYEPNEDILGGRLRISGSAAVLTVGETPADPGANGPDSRRGTIESDWERTFTLSDGLRLEPFLNGRFDLYSLANLTPPDPYSAILGRGWGTIGLNVSYPLIKQSAGVTYLLEPMGQIAISPNTHFYPLIPNEDSEIWQFDETNLFQPNKSPGYDLYEGGQSVTVGGRATVMFPDGKSGSLLVGRVLGFEDQPPVPQRTGLQTALSDYVVSAEATPVKGVSLFTKARFDSNTFDANYLESGADFSTSRVSGYIAYLYERDSPTGGPIDSVDVHGEVDVTKHWGATAYAIVDGGTWRQTEFGVVYKDPCVRVEVIYRHNETFNSTLGPSTSVVLRLSLATLGNSGYSH